MAKKPADKDSSKSAQAGHYAPPPPPDAFGKGAAPVGDDDPVQASRASLHDLFSQQARTMLERTDLDEEQKQAVLVAMSCPCCGAGGMSFTAKLKPKMGMKRRR
jgi:hypothetical protein